MKKRGKVKKKERRELKRKKLMQPPQQSQARPPEWQETGMGTFWEEVREICGNAIQLLGAVFIFVAFEFSAGAILLFISAIGR
jgi:hypothetical protein